MFASIYIVSLHGPVRVPNTYIHLYILYNKFVPKHMKSCINVYLQE